MHDRNGERGYQDPRDRDPRDRDPRDSDTKQIRTEHRGDRRNDHRSDTKDRRKPPQPDFGAFYIFDETLPILLDVDLAVVLGNHILEHGSENAALMAFGHRLLKSIGD